MALMTLLRYFTMGLIPYPFALIIQTVCERQDSSIHNVNNLYYEQWISNVTRDTFKPQVASFTFHIDNFFLNVYKTNFILHVDILLQ